AGLTGERAERRVALEHEVVGRAEHRQLVEVVHQEDRVEAGAVGRRRLRRDHVEQALAWGVGIVEVRDLVAETGHGAPQGEAELGSWWPSQPYQIGGWEDSVSIRPSPVRRVGATSRRGGTMEYLLIICSDESAMAAASPAEAEASLARYMQFGEDMTKRGVLR